LNKKKIYYTVIFLLITVNFVLIYFDSINVEDRRPDISVLLEDVADSNFVLDEFEIIDAELINKNFEKKWMYSKKTDSLWFKYVKVPDNYSLARYNYFMQKLLRKNDISIIKATEHELSNKLIYNFKAGDSIDAVLEIRIVKDIERGNVRLGGSTALLVNGLGDEWGPEWITKLLRSEIPLSVGVIPGRWAVAQIVNEARENGKEILISLPMEPEKGNIDKEKYKIIKGMNEFTINIVLDNISQQIPHTAGVINYKGSRVISDFNTMDFLIQNLSSKGLFYLEHTDQQDSYSALLCAQYGVPFTSREIIYFRDTIDNYEIEKIFRDISEGQDILIVIDANEDNFYKVTKQMLNFPDINILTVSQFTNLNKL